MLSVEGGRHTTRGEGRGLPCPFLKIERSALILEKKTLTVHPWVESPIQNVVLRVSRRKSSRKFPCGTFFLVHLTKGFWKCPNSINFSSPEKFLVARLGGSDEQSFCSCPSQRLSANAVVDSYDNENIPQGIVFLNLFVFLDFWRQCF